ncbi:amino acid permease [Steroidobacter flavus]|uniref:Amino acid permease n=1 Tax=Steroidobacter flavus TaxID=1842136 RepID=A0ABV8T5H2_9GAMM
MNRRIKPVEACIESAERKGLERTLGPIQLMLLGVGAVIGTGIFVLTAVGAERAGPGLLLSFVIAATVCAFAALAYAELAAMVPVAGSAYTYSYVVIGELVAWLVGWNLILEYAVAGAAVAVGWSGYMTGLLQSMGIEIPLALKAGMFAVEGGGVNLIAVTATLTVTGLLIVGTRESVYFTTALVFVKMLALGAFIFIAVPRIDWANFQPFMPYGFGTTEEGGVAKGVMAAAALIFFAYIGFDAVSTAAEETRNPNRNVPIGLIGSLIICTTVYVLVAAGAVGTTSYLELAGNTEPLASILRTLGFPTVGNLVALAAIIALPTVVLMMVFAQTRILFVMSRDGLLPEKLSTVHPRFRTPHIITMVTGLFVAVVSGLFSVDEIAELSNTGTLFAFVVVSISVMVLRRAQPDRHRPFRCPTLWLVGPLAVAGCLYLFSSLPKLAQGRFAIWTAIGAVVYFLYGYRRSPLGKQ